MIIIECIECGKQFDAQRSSAKFCSTNCRVKHNKKLSEAPKPAETTKGNEILKPQVGLNERDMPWIKQIYDYCRVKGIYPDYLIEFHELHSNSAVSKLVTTLKKEFGGSETRKPINTESGKNRQMYEPEEGTRAHFLRYGAFYKKDIKSQTNKE